MLAIMDNFNGLEKFFAVCAVVGGIFFVIRLVLQFVGGDGDFDGDIDGDIDADLDGGDSDISFKVLSFQGLTAFFMMFGLVGLALSWQTGWDPVRSIAGATAAGFGTVWVLKLIFNSAKDLQSSGTINMQNAVGQEGSIYLTIPDNGIGKARVTVQEHLKVFDARSANEREIKTGTPIRVVRIVSNNVLIVEPIE